MTVIKEVVDPKAQSKIVELEKKQKELETFLTELTKALKGRTDIIPNLSIGLGLKKALPELEDKSKDEVRTGA